MIRGRASRALTAAAVLLTAAPAGGIVSPATAEEASSADVRAADHQGFGRVVLNTNGKAAYKVDQVGDHVTVHVTGNVSLGAAPSAPRNVVAIKTNGAKLDLTLTHGAQVRTSRVNGHIVLDVMDVAAAKTHSDQAPPNPQPQPAPPAETPASHTPAQTPAKPPRRSHTQVADAPPIPPEPQAAARTPAVPQALQAPQLPKPASMARSPELGGRSTPTTPILAALPSSDPTKPEPGKPEPGKPELGKPEPGKPGLAKPEPANAARPPVLAQALPAPSSSSPAPLETVQPVTEAAALELVQPTPPGRDALPENEGPLALRARRTRLPKEMDGTAFIVPFSPTTAAAAFDAGDSTYIVFDERRPVDLAGLTKDPLFASASVRLLPTGTLFQVPHPSTLSITLTQLPQGWRIAALTSKPKQLPIVASYADKRLNLAADQPGDVVNLADPVTGATLLVGTQHRPGQGVVFSRLSTEFILRPSTQGVVVEPLSDVISLKQTPTGFVLGGAPSGLSLSPVTGITPVLMDAAHLTRRLNLSTMPPEALLRLAVKQIGDAGKVPPLARGPRHRAAAESFLALGLAAEAQTLLQMAVEQDPKEAASPDTNTLSAVAALLAGRVDEARGLTDARVGGTDEIALWRALLQATQDDGSPAAAAVFSTTAPLAFQYPPAVRDHILPLIIETMIQGGESTAAARLLDQRKDDPKLAYARAILSQVQGNTPEALTKLDAVANGHDQFDRARAAIRAVELRLATGEIDKKQAADALDKLLYAWRGDSRDLALRQRVADLRSQTGGWRTALAMLRQAETDFPEQAPALHVRLKDMFAAMIRDQGTDTIPPIDFVATVDENTDLVPPSGDNEQLDQALADRLVALDLPVRAKPLLEKLLRPGKVRHHQGAVWRQSGDTSGPRGRRFRRPRGARCVPGQGSAG